MNLGIDLGTSGCKVATETGEVCLRSDALYPDTPLPDGTFTHDDTQREHLDRTMQVEILTRVGEQIPCVYFSQTDGHVIRHADDLYASQIGQVLHAGDPIHNGFAVAAGRKTAFESGFERAHDDDASRVIAVPAWWSPRASKLVSTALSRLGWSNTLLASAPELAVTAMPQLTHHDGNTAVVDLGANTSSVSIVDQTSSRPSMIEGSVSYVLRGGDQIDVKIARHFIDVLAASDLDALGDTALGGLAPAPDELGNPNNPAAVKLAHQLMSPARHAKEHLSTHPAINVKLNLDGTDVTVRLVRSELEELAAPWIDQVMQLLQTSQEHASSQVNTVLLTGGSTIMPMVAQRISAEFGYPIVVGDNPMATTSVGAAQHATAHGLNAASPSGLRRLLPRRRPSRHRSRRNPAYLPDHDQNNHAPPGGSATPAASAESPLSIFQPKSANVPVAENAVDVVENSLRIQRVGDDVVTHSHGVNPSRH